MMLTPQENHLNTDGVKMTAIHTILEQMHQAECDNTLCTGLFVSFCPNSLEVFTLQIVQIVP